MASTEDLFQNPDAAGEATEAPAPARKRARRATKKASAPTAAASAEQPSAEQPSAEQPSAEQASAEQAEAPAGARADAPAAATANKSAAPVKKAAKKTAKKAAPRRSAKKAAETAPAVEVLDDALADLVTEGAEPRVADLPTAADASSHAEPETPSDDDDEDEVEVAPVVPSFGLLFQAPDVTKAPTRPSRRAGAKAGPPAPPAPADTATPEPAQSDTDATADAASDVVSDATDEQDSEATDGGRRRRRRGGKGRGRGRTAGDDANEASDSSDRPGAADDSTQDTGADSDVDQDSPAQGDDGDEHDDADSESQSTRRRRRRRRGGAAGDEQDPPGTVTRVREARRDEPQSVKGSTRLEAKKQRRREGREAGRRRTVITEAEFLARRESVERVMVVRERDGKTQIGVLEDDVLVEHYVSRESNVSMAGNVYLGRVQNVLPSMEAAFVDIGKGRNAVLYAGEVNWDAAGLENNQPKRIENALKSGDAVLVQVTKDPIGHKGARLTSQISLPGRYLVYVPEGSMTGISRKLPDTERGRLKGILKEVVPDSAGVIVRTAAEGASEDELRADVERLTRTWEKIKAKADTKSKAKGGSPVLVHGEPDLTVRVIRDVFNEDFSKLVVAGDQAYADVSEYLGDVAPDLAERLEKWTSERDLFTHHRVDEQIAKAMDRKVWLPSGGSLVIDRTEAMTVVDVNTGKFVGSGGNLEETVTKNNVEAAEEIVRQLRLRDIGGIIVIDFIDMVLESNRDLVVRRLLECLGRDRTKHQVAEVTSLGLVQMTRKRVGSGLIEVFSETCEHCGGRGIIIHTDPVEKSSFDGGSGSGSAQGPGTSRTSRPRRGRASASTQPVEPQVTHSGPTPAQIAAAAHAAALKSAGDHHDDDLTELEPYESDAPLDAVLREEPIDAEPVAAARIDAEPVQAVQAAPRRRKRGRVVAPAGPPRHVDENSEENSHENSDDAPESAAAEVAADAS